MLAGAGAWSPLGVPGDLLARKFGRKPRVRPLLPAPVPAPAFLSHADTTHSLNRLRIGPPFLLLPGAALGSQAATAHSLSRLRKGSQNVLLRAPWPLVPLTTSCRIPLFSSRFAPPLPPCLIRLSSFQLGALPPSEFGPHCRMWNEALPQPAAGFALQGLGSPCQGLPKSSSPRPLDPPAAAPGRSVEGRRGRERGTEKSLSAKKACSWHIKDALALTQPLALALSLTLALPRTVALETAPGRSRSRKGGKGGGERRPE